MKYLPILSASSIKEANRCPKCFWMDRVKKVKCPQMSSFGLANAIDELLKSYYDNQRKKKCVLPYGVKLYTDQSKLNEWRDWKKGLPRFFDKNAQLMGAIDEMGFTKHGGKMRMVPIDYKTKQVRPYSGYGEKWYKLQMSIYGFLLKNADYDIEDYALLAFYSPHSMSKVDTFKFDITYQAVQMDLVLAEDSFIRAQEILTMKACPPSNPGCTVCEYVDQAKHIKMR